MDGIDDRCVVCGELSEELICRACHTLIRGKPRDVAAARSAPTELAMNDAAGRG